MGHFEYTLMFCIIALGVGADGRSIRSELRSRTGRQVTPGAVYTVLQRLEAKGFIAGWLGDPTPRRGGRRPRHYRVLPEGARALLETHGTLERVSDGLLGAAVQLAAVEGGTP